MIIKTYGTRGSVPVAGPDHVKYGGNTTCLHIDSECLPEKKWLVIDAGTGIIPLTKKGLKAGIEELYFLFTHYHYDHIQGLLLSPWTYIKNIALNLYGPDENGIGPKQMMTDVMRPPYHPVGVNELISHMKFKGIVNPTEMVFVIHPQGGPKLCSLQEIDLAESNGSHGQLTFPGHTKYSIDECLIIRMFRSNHPERTISYRFEERPTGKVFVFLTDHENQDRIPAALKAHLNGADFLIMDSQYTRAIYDDSRAGFGHGTPDFCVQVAKDVDAKMLGLTHHDPDSTDEHVNGILKEARMAAARITYTSKIEACKDYDEFTLKNS